MSLGNHSRASLSQSVCIDSKDDNSTGEMAHGCVQLRSVDANRRAQISLSNSRADTETVSYSYSETPHGKGKGYIFIQQHG